MRRGREDTGGRCASYGAELPNDALQMGIGRRPPVPSSSAPRSSGRRGSPGRGPRHLRAPGGRPAPLSTRQAERRKRVSPAARLRHRDWLRSATSPRRGPGPEGSPCARHGPGLFPARAADSEDSALGGRHPPASARPPAPRAPARGTRRPNKVGAGSPGSAPHTARCPLARRRGTRGRAPGRRRGSRPPGCAPALFAPCARQLPAPRPHERPPSAPPPRPGPPSGWFAG